MSYGDSGIVVVDQGSRSVRAALVKDWEDLVGNIEGHTQPVVRALFCTSAAAAPLLSAAAARQCHPDSVADCFPLPGADGRHVGGC